MTNYHSMDDVDETPPAGVEIYTDDCRPAASTGILNYWYQRHALFSRYEEGIWLTKDGWFGVTPEKVAKKIAEHVLQSPVETVLDVFCGMGGNTIQFALSPSCNRVVAIDSDPAAVECAKHNAKIYGVLDKIDFIVGDIFQLVRDDDPRIVADVVFMSPPWGGPEYRSFTVFNLETMKPYPISLLVEQALKISPNVALYLPRTSDLNQLAGLVPGDKKAQAIHYCLRQRSKALMLYTGNLSRV